MPLAKRQYSAVLLPLLVLVASAMALGLSVSRGGFFDTTDNAGSYFDAACTPGTSTYDFTGVTSPSSTHVALDGEIDETDAVIENGTFGARRDTITGWANWGEATSGEYSNLVTSDNLYYQGLDPGSDDNAAMLFELTAGEDPSCVARIDVTVEGAQGGSPGSDLLFVYLWDYNTGSYLVGGSMNGTTDQVVSFSVTANPGDYVQAADGQITVFVVNEDTSDWIRVDRITVDVAVDASADLTGTLVPSALEGEIVAGGETLIITLTNDSWDPTVGADNAITTALINGIDSAQGEATGWDAVVKANLDFNDVTRTSPTVVTVTLGAEPTYQITGRETITVTVPASAVAGGETLVITLTNDTWDPTVGADNAITTAVINGIDSAQAESTGWDAVVKAGLTFNEVVRTSNTVVTVTLPAFATYGITADETITVTVPATAVTGNAIVAAPTFNVITRFSAALTSVADTDGEENDADKNFGTGGDARAEQGRGNKPPVLRAVRCLLDTGRFHHRLGHPDAVRRRYAKLPQDLRRAPGDGQLGGDHAYLEQPARRRRGGNGFGHHPDLSGLHDLDGDGGRAGLGGRHRQQRLAGGRFCRGGQRLPRQVPHPRKR